MLLRIAVNFGKETHSFVQIFKSLLGRCSRQTLRSMRLSSIVDGRFSKHSANIKWRCLRIERVLPGIHIQMSFKVSLVGPI